MKWEYEEVYLGNYPDQNAITYNRVTILNNEGLDGWELVSVYRGYAYFKRLIK